MRPEAAEPPIKPRDVRFQLEDALANDWNGGDPFRTAMFNAMSILFPIGEKSFIDSVRAFENCVTDPWQRQQVKGFMAQEYVHRREHQRLNEILCQQRGYDLVYLEAAITKAMEDIPNIDSLFWLATTVAYEHLTATIAYGILTQDNWFAGAHPEVERMWNWHAIEEIEHKSVAFDVYIAAGGTRKMLRQAMLVVSYEFIVPFVGRNLRHMLKRDRVPFFKTAASGCRFLLGRGGFIRTLWRHYWQFFGKTFHPNAIDDHAVLTSATARLGFA